jgi:energy-coupling factor transporter ATP-binding protein EcfA2
VIYKLEILDPTKTPVPWLARVEALAKPHAFEFKPGLNVLWGRNGSGKTSLTRVLARLFHCEQGNRSIVTQESLRELAGGKILDDGVDVKAGLSVRHDGQCVRHFDPSHAVGLMGGMAAFDWDFGAEGLTNAMFKGSAGQTTMFRFDRLINEIVAGVVPEVEWKFSRANRSGVWAPRAKLAEHFLKGNAKEGQPTIILDEPERSFDLNAQVGVFFAWMYGDDKQRDRAFHAGDELPQGHFLIHNMSGLTLMAWWDRTHGDKRGACNSVYAVEGDFGADQMLEWWPRHFPLQAKHMEA